MNDLTFSSVPDSVYSSSSLFSWRRCKAYALNFCADNSKKLWLSVGGIFLVTLIFMIFILYLDGLRTYNYYAEYSSLGYTADSFHDSSMMIFKICLVGIMALAGSMMFGSLSSKSKRLYSLEIPASQFEKFITWLFIFLPLTIVASWVCFYVADIIRVIWVKSFTPYGDAAHILSFSHVIVPFDFEFSIDRINSLIVFYSSCLIINALFALGGIIFHKMSILKTGLSLSILGCVIIVIAVIGYQAFFPGDSGIFVEMDSYGHINQIRLGIVFFSVIISGLIYYLAYYRMKESEIISRW